MIDACTATVELVVDAVAATVELVIDAITTPVELAYLPVNSDARNAEHTGVDATKFRNSMPSCASRSMLGVIARGSLNPHD